MTPAQRRFAQAQQMAEQERLRQQLQQAMQARRPAAQGSRTGSMPMSSSRRALQAMQEPLRRAQGGMVTNAPRIPTLMELAQPNFQMQQAQVSEAPFTQQNPVVPMSMQQSPAFGGMPQDVYNWTPSQVSGGALTATPRQPPAMTTGTSTYTPVDTSSIGGMNIPGAADIASGALPSILDRRRAEEERLRQEQEAQAELERLRQAQTDELLQRQQAFEEQLAAEQQRAAQAQERLTGFESTFDERLQQGIAAELARREQLERDRVAAEQARIQEEEAAAARLREEEAARLREEEARRAAAPRVSFQEEIAVGEAGGTRTRSAPVVGFNPASAPRLAPGHRLSNDRQFVLVPSSTGIGEAGGDYTRRVPVGDYNYRNYRKEDEQGA